MNDSELDHLLKSCGSCHTPPGFSSDVWNRIAVEPDSAGPLPAWKHFIAEIFDRMSQPIGAITTCAAFGLAGTLMGISARQESLPPEVQYVRSVSPFLQRPSK